MRSNIKFLAAISLFVVLTGCGKHSKVREDTKKEYMESKPEIYGKLGEPARQSKNPNTTNPDAAARSAVLKEKLFSNYDATAAKIDTAAALSRQAE